MSFNPIEAVRAVFPNEMMNKMAGLLGESTTQVQQAMQGVIPSVITGIILKTEFGDAFDTYNLSKEAAKIEIPFNQTSLAWWWNTHYKGVDYLKSLFGGKSTDLTEAISSYAGVSGKTASSLLNVVAPAAYSVLGRHILETNMNANGLRNLLESEKKRTLNTLPAGIFMEGIMGFENLSGFSEKFTGVDTLNARPKHQVKWVIPLILVALIAGTVWYFLIRQEPAELSSVPVIHKPLPPKDTVVSVPVRDSRYSVKLSDGKLLYIKKGSMEDQLATFFNDPKSRPSRRFLFNFDETKFNTGTAVITKESMSQIENIALILKSFPKAKIKIAGFNEKGGDSVLNSTLSENRAEAVARALKTAGVTQGQLTGAEGFGSDFAQYAVDAPDSLRDKDRRIALSVRAK